MAQIPEAPIPSASGPTPPSGGSGQAPWIIAGGIVFAALLVVIALVMLNKDSGSQTPTETPIVSPTEQIPSPTETKPPHTRSPRPSRSPKPSPEPSPSPSPSPVPDDSTLVRESAEKAAEADRPGEVKHVGNVSFFKDSACATREGAAATVRYTSSPKAASFLLCKNTHGKWKVTQGPLYGE